MQQERGREPLRSVRRLPRTRWQELSRAGWDRMSAAEQRAVVMSSLHPTNHVISGQTTATFVDLDAIAREQKSAVYYAPSFSALIQRLRFPRVMCSFYNTGKFTCMGTHELSLAILAAHKSTALLRLQGVAPARVSAIRVGNVVSTLLAFPIDRQRLKDAFPGAVNFSRVFPGASVVCEHFPIPRFIPPPQPSPTRPAALAALAPHAPLGPAAPGGQPAPHAPAASGSRKSHGKRRGGGAADPSGAGGSERTKVVIEAFFHGKANLTCAHYFEEAQHVAGWMYDNVLEYMRVDAAAPALAPAHGAPLGAYVAETRAAADAAPDDPVVAADIAHMLASIGAGGPTITPLH